jgi:signal transduction histidine kinase
MRLQNRLVLYFTGGVFLLTAGVMAVVVSGPARILREQATKRAIALAKSLGSTSMSSLPVNDWVALEQYARAVAEGEDVAMAAVLDPTGKVIVDTRSGQRDAKHTEDLSAELPEDTVARIVFPPDADAEVVDVLEPVYLERTRETCVGAIRLRLSLRSIERQTAALQVQLLLVGAVATVLGIGAAKIFARRITKPIDRLVEATIRVVEGDLQTKIGIDTRDEIGELGRNFDRMTIEILRERQRISDLNRRLEAEVQERTKELVHANANLEKTNEDLSRTVNDLRTAQAQLVQSEKMASLGQLVAGVVHEINNPLNFIYNGIPPLADMIGTIRAATVGSCPAGTPAAGELAEQFEAADEILSALREGAKRATTIVKDLRSFSRLDESDLKVGDVHEGIETTLNLLGHRLKNKVTVRRGFAAVPPFEFYPALMNQVFMNLFSNAEEAIEGHGEIRIETRLEQPWVVIVVEDTGKGIPPETVSRIFEPFFSTKDVGKGMGLGLSISYGIIEKHGGQIHVESQVGAGTRFTIRIPFRRKDSPMEVAVS